ncbi:MAG: hypothetical protein LQ344_007940 [Seirophora lacunosa]|nr:MAG: hypothetical protein LQ344_007940 [Seirophora lacunosa]
MSRRTLRPPAAAQTEVREIYILVMGLTGAGKSTFISVVTENPEIPIGEPDDMDGVTENVKDYIVNIRQGGIIYEVHLIDSPGFDDGAMADVKVLTRIADFVNLHYKLGHTLAGVLYLHDITKAKMGGVGERNLRMLEGMIGINKWDNCTLVTTKWGCTTNLKGEEAREKKLMHEEHYFGAMLRNSHQASIVRFDPKSKGRALDIIKPHLKRRFDPLISEQMVKEGGPMLNLGDTSAGQIVADHLEELRRVEGQKKETEEAIKLLGRKFDLMLFEKYKAKSDKLLREQRLHKIGRWATRTTIVGGAIAATVVTFGPGASAFALTPAYETYAARQKSEDRAKMTKLERDFEEESQTNTHESTGGYRPGWVRDAKVKSLDDLADNYSIRSSSSTDLSAVETVPEVATEMASFSIKDAAIP